MPSNIPGYLVPTASDPLPGGLSLQDFIQTVIVGISGYTGSLVRPKWQQSPPKQPAANTDWIAFGLQINAGDANAFAGFNDSDVNILQRNESLSIQVAFYGPNAQNNSSVFRDGFWIQQNLEAMRLAQMGFTGITPAIRGPDLVNERWVERYEMTLTLTRQVQRTYPVLSFASAVGSIHTIVDNEDLQIDFAVEEP